MTRMDSILKTELTNVMDDCDRIDYTPDADPGVRRLRDTCRMELGHFLLYIADGKAFPTSEQAQLISSVWSGVHPSVTHFELKKIMDELSFPTVSENETLAAFIKAGKADRLIRLYDIYGGFMVSLGMNAPGEGRYRLYMDRMRKRASAGITE